MLRADGTSSDDDDYELDDEPLGNGAVVLAPNKEHEFNLAKVNDALADASAEALPAFHRAIVFNANPTKPFFVHEGRLVLWQGYAKRLLDGCREDAPTARGQISVWRAEIWVEGLFSMVFWALGFLEHTSKTQPRSRLLIDWTDQRITFYPSNRRPEPSCNVWNDFFEQPPGEGSGSAPPTAAPAARSAELLGAAAASGDLSIVCRFGLPKWFGKFGAFRGADQGEHHCGSDDDGGAKKGGRLDAASAEAGRAAFARWIRVRPPVQERANDMLRTRLPSLRHGASSYGSGFLAVHVRRTDKLLQCGANRIGNQMIIEQVRSFASALGCTGIFLCTDDVALKAEVAASLRTAGLVVASLDALLAAKRNAPSHKPGSGVRDRRRNAEDCLVETLVMSRCDALLSTWSNVSVAAVYFSPPGYRHYMFGDDVPQAPAPASDVLATAPPRSEADARALTPTLSVKTTAWTARTADLVPVAAITAGRSSTGCGEWRRRRQRTQAPVTSS